MLVADMSVSQNLVNVQFSMVACSEDNQLVDLVGFYSLGVN